MRTNIPIDNKLLEQALKATGPKTNHEAVELGLRTILRLAQQEKIREFRGDLAWEGDLEAMRTNEQSWSTQAYGPIISAARQ